MINYGLQAKMIKPTAKSCMWCKYSNIFGSYDDFILCAKQNTKHTHRTLLKSIKENEFRYCNSYRYSKLNFKAWKTERNINSKTMFGGYTDV